MSNKTIICKWCKKEYVYKPYVNGKVYCSKKCQYFAYHEKQAKFCENCGIKFYTRTIKKFCSDKCRLESLKSKKIKISCGNCKKDILVNFSKFISAKNHFCSEECLKSWQKENRSNELNPNWSGGNVEIVCQICGKKFKVINARKKTARFCSSSCFGVWSTKNNIHYNGHKSGFRDDLGLSFRSRWEANFARYLNFLGMKWEFEPKTFRFENQKTGTVSYTPDFYLKDINTYVEIKGYLDSVSKSKLKKMSNYYKEVDITLLMKEDYFKIEREFGWKIDGWEWANEEEAQKMLVYKKVIERSPNILKVLKGIFPNIKKMKIIKKKIPLSILNTLKTAEIKAKKENKIPCVVFVEKGSQSPILMCNIHDLKTIAQYQKEDLNDNRKTD